MQWLVISTSKLTNELYITGLRDVEADGDSLGSKAPGVLNSKHNDMRAPATSLQVLEMDTGDMKSSHGAYSQVGL